ncbi:MAG: TIM barrel protein [Treponema sp.]|nr:TIM barrel protein [Treponema sp.]
MKYKLGLKLGSKDTQYTDDILRYYAEGVFQYIELFAISDTFDDSVSYWKQFNIPFGIHAPHSAAGLNLACRENREINKSKIEESIKFADSLKADYIIFHSGVNGTCDEVVTQLKPFVDSRFLIENKPIKGLDGSTCVGATISELDSIISELNSGFCLDFGHAICAARTQGFEPLDYIKSLKEKFNPRVYHLTDGDYESELDRHLHYGDGSFLLKELLKFVPDGCKVTNEAKRNIANTLEEVKIDSVFLKII